MTRLFNWMCARGWHGPSRVRWGYAADCRTCTKIAWRHGWR